MGTVWHTNYFYLLTACPAVGGAYRTTQLAPAELYPDSYPVRGEITVVIGAPRDEPGYGPMANVIRHITGAAYETGFVGFNGYGRRNERNDWRQKTLREHLKVPIGSERRWTQAVIHVEASPERRD